MLNSPQFKVKKQLIIALLKRRILGSNNQEFAKVEEFHISYYSEDEDISLHGFYSQLNTAT